MELFNGRPDDFDARLPKEQRVYELLDRLEVCRTLIAHLQARRETRWPGFGIHTDYPARDDRYAMFVNSVLQDGEIRMIFRPLQVP